MKINPRVQDAVSQAVLQVLPRGSSKRGLTADADLRNDLGIDSIGLISLIDLVDEGLGVDLSAVAQKFAEVRLLGELMRLCDELYASKAGSPA